MANDDWEEVLRDKKDPGFGATLVQILTLGIAEKPEIWEVEYRNKRTGEKVHAEGPSAADAERNAKKALSLEV